jgi:hypothetical protein
MTNTKPEKVSSIINDKEEMNILYSKYERSCFQDKFAKCDELWTGNETNIKACKMVVVIGCGLSEFGKLMSGIGKGP